MSIEDEIKKCCLTCVHGKDAADSKITCSHNSQAAEAYVCDKYKYNAYLKRPPKRRTLPTFSPEEFSID